WPRLREELMDTENMPTIYGEKYLAIQRSPQFARLRRRSRGFIGPMIAADFGWWALCVLLAGWAPGFFSTQGAGNINLAMIFTLPQFASTTAITAIYLTYARRRLDPAARLIRDEFEGKPR